MSEHTTPAGAVDAPRTSDDGHRVDTAQYGLAAVVALVGAYTIYDATTLTVGFADPVGPQAFPYAIGGVMVLLGGLLALATARGDRPQAEEGEDVDLTLSPDWTTVLKLVAVFVVNIVLVDRLGWAVTGAILFAGCTWALGSRTIVKDVLIGAVLSVGSWYFFYVGLDIPLTPGILEGIL